MSAFWLEKELHEMSDAEWESLCDGCARCCMIKLQDEDTDEVFYTAAVCDLLDLDACRCTRYPQRHELVADCVVLDAQTAQSFDWLPTTCAYRRVANRQPLPDWHPLLSGRADSVHEADVSVLGKVVHERTVHEQDLQSMIVRWIEQ